MNYLAHLYLANHVSRKIDALDNDKLLLGNYLGDFVKGKVDNLETQGLFLHEQVKQGIRMHRKVDVLADQRIQNLLQEGAVNFSQRRYAGITFDLACDHFLAKHWESFSAMPLEHFSEHCIDSLQRQQVMMPEKAQLTFSRLVRHEWLTSYQDMDYMEAVFQNIQRRLNKTDVSNTFDDFLANYQRLENVCRGFISDIQNQKII